MKMKAVSEITGLSDRTVRYYIEQDLIHPSYMENYFGRKNFDFSESDVETLKNISVLRKFDFTIDEIRKIIQDEKSSTAIIFDVKKRVGETVTDGQLKMNALSRTHSLLHYSLSELAEILSKPAEAIPDYREPAERRILRRIGTILKKLLVVLIVWPPILWAFFVVFMRFGHYSYPTLSLQGILLTIYGFSPSVAVLILSRIKWSGKKSLRRFFLVFCILFIPRSCLWPFSVIPKSETTDIDYYRNFDSRCLANRNGLFQELFPVWVEGTYDDAKYYYRYLDGMDYTYDIYAEWSLEEEEYAAEVDRAVNVMIKHGVQRERQTRGNYECWIEYSGDAPFHEATNNYSYTIFAYNDETRTVRYICCSSLENGADQPYYLSLDW